MFTCSCKDVSNGIYSCNDYGYKNVDCKDEPIGKEFKSEPHWDSCKYNVMYLKTERNKTDVCNDKNIAGLCIKEEPSEIVDFKDRKNNDVYIKDKPSEINSCDGFMYSDIDSKEEPIKVKNWDGINYNDIDCKVQNKESFLRKLQTTRIIH